MRDQMNKLENVYGQTKTKRKQGKKTRKDVSPMREVELLAVRPPLHPSSSQKRVLMENPHRPFMAPKEFLVEEAKTQDKRNARKEEEDDGSKIEDFSPAENINF